MKGESLEDRQSQAAAAKAAMLEKFKARPAPDPEKLAELRSREENRATRKQLAQIARKERLEAEKLEREAQKKREEEARIEAEFARQAAIDLARTEREAAEKGKLARQKSMLDAWANTRKRSAKG